MWLYIGIAVIVVVIVCGMIFTAKRNGEIDRDGVETFAVVTRVKEQEDFDADGASNGVTYTYYVTYQTPDGQSVEAKLGSGKSVDIRIGGRAWDADLSEGVRVRIKYLPAKPKYVIRVQD
ncbi:MAG: hypothetical protein IJU41_00340 [Clostridia bacterium]|nr:hypothetical protein [Clostridia bacterium]